MIDIAIHFDIEVTIVARQERELHISYVTQHNKHGISVDKHDLVFVYYILGIIAPWFIREKQNSIPVDLTICNDVMDTEYCVLVFLEIILLQLLVHVTSAMCENIETI